MKNYFIDNIIKRDTALSMLLKKGGWEIVFRKIEIIFGIN